MHDEISTRLTLHLITAAYGSSHAEPADERCEHGRKRRDDSYSTTGPFELSMVHLPLLHFLFGLGMPLPVKALEKAGLVTTIKPPCGH